MKKGLVLLLLAFVSATLFIISCQHEPPVTTGCTGNFHLTYVATPDTTTNAYPDGAIVAVATGGATISYSINGGAAQSLGVFTGLSATQTYKIVAHNELGCSDSVTVTIDAYNGGGNPCPTITVTATGSNPTSSTATNGSITASATGGVAPYTYSINGVNYVSSGTFTGLTVGSYVIHVKDANNCPGTSAQVTLSAGGGPCPTITVTATGSNPTTSTAANGTISATATGGAAPYTYSINGVNYVSSGTFTGLTVGSYTIHVKDANNCPGTSSQVTLSAGGGPCPTIVVTGTPANTSTICAVDGTITASATGGTAPYTYSKDGTTFQATGSFTALAAGAFTITAKDANGCTGTASVTVAGPATVHFATDVKPTINSYCGRANVSCHSHSNSWTTYADIVGTSTGTTWTSNLNTFLKRIRSTSGSAISQCPLTTASGSHDMPPSTSTAWTNFVKTALTNWVDQGYPNN